MEKLNIVDRCYHSCPFFESSDCMKCSHPFWGDKEFYESLIITHENSMRGKFPEECPLREEDLIIKYQLKIKK